MNERFNRLEAAVLQRTTIIGANHDAANDGDAIARYVRAELISILSSLTDDMTGSGS
jgi:hypothetical protein